MTASRFWKHNAFNPLKNNNPIAGRRRKLIAKIDVQIQLAANKDFTPTQHKWVSDEHGNQRKVEAAELGELDVLIEQQAQFGRRVTLKNKWTNE